MQVIRKTCFLAVFWLVALLAAGSGKEGNWKDLIQTGATAYQRGDYARAEKFFKQALQAAQKLEPGDVELSYTFNNLSVLYCSLGRLDDALESAGRALAIRERLYGKDAPMVATVLNNLADIHRMKGNADKAEPIYRRALEIWEQSFGKDNTSVATALANLAELYRMEGRFRDALPMYERAVSIFERDPESSVTLATVLNNLGANHSGLRNLKKAESYFKRSLDLLEQTGLGSTHPTAAAAWQNLAEIQRDLGDYLQAQTLYQRSLKIWEGALGPHNPGLVDCMVQLADTYRISGNYEEAEQLYRRSLAIQEETYGPRHPGVAAGLDKLILLFRDIGKHPEASRLEMRAREIRSEFAP